MDKLEKYSKRLKLGNDFLTEYENISFEDKKEFLTKVLEISVKEQEVNRKNRLIKQAKFDVVKTFEGYCFDNIQFPEGLLLDDVKTGSFINKKYNLILYGPVGTGKTYLATAIGVEACNQGKKVRFFKISRLMNEILEAYEKGQQEKFLNNLKKYDLIILDELGYIPVGEKAAEYLYQVISECYEQRSLIITTNLEFGKWNSIFMDKKITTAILDRLVHYSYLVFFTGESYRLKNAISRIKGGAL